MWNSSLRSGPLLKLIRCDEKGVKQGTETHYFAYSNCYRKEERVNTRLQIEYLSTELIPIERAIGTTVIRKRPPARNSIRELLFRW